MFVSLLPAIFFLILDSSDWPNNWDDFQRLFNGIAPDHSLIKYGILVWNNMMKLVVHDPALTLTNRLRFQFPWLTLLAEIFLLLLPVLLLSRLAYLKNEIWLCICISMGFSGLIAVHTVFLPPAGYPLAFSLAFCGALLISIDSLNAFLYRYSAPIISLILSVLEQMAFVFYATCYLQSFFITLAGIVIISKKHQLSLISERVFPFILGQILRFSVLPVITILWRLSHTVDSAESISSNLTLIGVIRGLIKWPLGGTSISTLLGMGNPRMELVNNADIPQVRPILYAIILVFFLSCLIWSRVFYYKNESENQSIITNNIFFDSINPYLATFIIGLGICLAWSLPMISSRYYSEIQEYGSEIYVSMRYASIGFILVSMSVLAYFFKYLDLLITQSKHSSFIGVFSKSIGKLTLLCFLPLWLYTGLVNINSIYTKSPFLPQGISLRAICSKKDFTDFDYTFWGDLVPDEVIYYGVDGWLPSLKSERKQIDRTDPNLKQFIGKTFIQNAQKLCH